MVDFRKLISFGKSSYVISLPKAWVVKHNLVKGDLIRVDDEMDNLILNPSPHEKKTVDTISINITKFDSSSIVHYLQALYKKGFDDINVTFDNLETVDYKTGKKIKVCKVMKTTVARLIGFEIVSQKDKGCVIKSISSTSLEEFDNVLRRIFLLLIEISKDAVEGNKELNVELLKAIEEMHENITRFIAFCLRILNKKYRDFKKAPFLYHIVSSLDKITDVYKYASREVTNKKQKVSNETIEVLEAVNASLTMFYELFYKFDHKTVIKLSENRRLTRKKVFELENKLSSHDVYICSQLVTVLDILLDLTEARMAMEY